MSIVMKNKFTLAALAVSSVLMMGSAQAEDFTATVNIVSPQDCPIVTTAPAGTQWDMTWNLANIGDTSGTLSYDAAPTTALPIQARLDSGAAGTCNLYGLKVSASSPTTTEVAGHEGFFDASTLGGAVWRFAPVLADMKLYSDDGITAIDTAANALTVTDASSANHVWATAPQYTARTEMTAVAGMDGNTAVALSDNHFATNADVLLAGAQAVGYTLATPQDVKAVDLGVSAIIGTNPTDAISGTVAPLGVNNGEVVTMPFTVDVTYH